MTTSNLFRNRPFLFVWLATAFSTIGFSMYTITVSWHLSKNLGLAAAVGIVLTVAALPRVVVMIVGGVLADKYQKSQVMFVTHVLQSFTIAGLCFFFYGDLLTFPLLLLFSFFMGLFDAFYWPASSSIIPTIVEESDLQRANSIQQGSHTLFYVVGPIIAGALISGFSVGISFLVSALMVVLSAVFVFPKWIKDVIPPKQTDQVSMTKELKEGIYYVKQSPILLYGVLIIVIIHFFVLGPLGNSFPILVTSLKGSALDLSYMEAALGVGTFMAALLMVIISKRKIKTLFIFSFLFVTAILLLIFSKLGSILWLTVLAAGIGFAAIAAYLPIITLIQQRTEQKKLGRVMSIVTLSSNGVEPLAFAFISGMMTAGFSIHALLTMLGAGCLLSGVILFVKGKDFRNIEQLS
ncbi:MFS transporter [Fictibacillus sp. 23RED33]|uniref:MFS transporter n=1 Tax=Fictibacillus sp. 23RED33 TaxID=2745879 RepID=UPI0018CFA88D|nr:MFS transporter [Fictibacillus sp. 23RED33]MBH0175686.1 MFS transporter [Fictibacillus sp. 23RED33]